MPHVRSLPVAFILLIAVAAPAGAHHPTGGAMPQTAWHGVLSGFGHPVIEVDHLLFVLAVAAMALAVDGGRVRLVFGFVAASLVGTAIHVARVDLLYAEAWVAVTLLIAAIALLRPRSPRAAWALAFCVAAGVVHGHAYGESILGAEATPLLAYLAGLALVQGVIAVVVVVAGRHLQRIARPLVTGRAALAIATTATGLYGLQAALLH